MQIFKLTNLFTEKIYRKLWRLTKPLTYGTPLGLVSVPVDFITDGASCPTILYNLCAPMTGAHAEAAVLHDFLYSKDSNGIFLVNRKTADKYFYAAMRANGTRYWRAKSIYLGVRAGGSKSYKACFSKDKRKD